MRPSHEQNRKAKAGERLPTLREPPPPPKRGGGSASPVYQAIETTGQLAFKSVAWREAHFEVVELTSVHRQREAVLLTALNDVRDGRAETDAVDQLIRTTSRDISADVGEPCVAFTSLKPGLRPVACPRSICGRRLEPAERRAERRASSTFSLPALSLCPPQRAPRVHKPPV